jgi:hypothetical protein
VDDVLVCLGVAPPVVHVPAQGLEEGSGELLPELHFVVLTRLIGFAVPIEAFDEIGNLLRQSHEPPKKENILVSSIVVLKYHQSF